MAKQKFELTSDLVKIVAEPNTYSLSGASAINATKPKEETKEQINLKISKNLKNDFQIWCINNDINMTEGLELALSKLINEQQDNQ